MQFGQFRPTRGQIAGFVLLIVTVFILGWQHPRIVFGDPSPATASSSQQTVTVMPAAQPTAAPSATPSATPTATPTSTTQVQSTYTPPPFAPNAVQVHPATGTMRGAYGTTVDTHTDNRVLRYSCGSDYREVYLGYDKTIEYNGATIDFTDDWYGNPGNPSRDDQFMVSITFTGNLSSLKYRLASIIVHNDDTFTGFYHDDRVINMNPSLVTPNGIKFYTYDMTDDGFTSGATLCVKR